MPKLFDVIITPSAKADLFETRLWLLENYPDYADKWLWRMTECITSLRKMPLRCRVSEEAAAFDVEVRELLCGSRRHTYRILYSVTKSSVFVLRVRSTRQRRLIDLLDDERE